MSGAGWTSYWVTTGPGVAADDPGRDAEAGQLLDDDLLVAGVGRLVAAGVERDGDVLEDRDRRQDVLDAVLGQRRVAGVGDVVGVTQRAASAATSVADAPAPRAGRERVRRLGPARDRRPGWRSSSSPQAPVWPGDGAAGTVLPFGPPVRAVRRDAAAAAAAPACGASSSSAAVASHRRRRPSCPIHLAVPTAGWHELPQRDPERDDHRRGSPRPTSRMNAPGRREPGRSGVPASARPIRPPRHAEDLGRTRAMPAR